MRLLCKIGIHKWDYNPVRRQTDNCLKFRVCKYCGHIEHNIPSYSYFIKFYKNQEPDYLGCLEYLYDTWYNLKKLQNE